MTLGIGAGVMMGVGRTGVSNSFILTCTTTGAQTLTLHGLTVAAGKTVTVDWGDSSSNDYTGAGARTHAYAGAGTWIVKMTKRDDITLLDLEDTKLSGTINASNPLPVSLLSLTIISLSGLTYNANTTPLPAGLTYLYLSTLVGLTYNANTNPLPAGLWYLRLAALAGLTYNANTNPLPGGLIYLILTGLTGLTYNANTNPLPVGLTYLLLSTLTGLTYNANTNPLPGGLTYLYLNTLVGLIWEINNSQKWPVGATAATIMACNSVTCTAWTDNAIRSIQWESSLNVAAVDNVQRQIWLNKANFTWATPTLDLLGGGNAIPSGAYADPSPADPSTGMEYKYCLNNDIPAAGPTWVVTTA
jgi:hypothetical protein